MSNLTALVEAAKELSDTGCDCDLCEANRTILELCALLEKAESDLNEAGDQLSTIVHLDGTCKRIYTLGVHLNKALAAIKQWKEQT